MNSTDNLPLVSVIIPCYNTEKYVAEALDSVVVQTYPNWEIIVIDDESTDSSPAILDRYATQYPDRIQIIRQKNQGVARSRMRAIAVARGEYLVPLDADDRLHADAIATWVAHQRANPDYKLIFSPVVVIAANGQVTGVRDFTMTRIDEPFEGNILPTLLVGNVIPSCVLVQREALLTAGGYYSEDLTRYAIENTPKGQSVANYLGTEDYFVYLQMALAGNAFGYVPRPLLDYRDTLDSRSKATQRVYNGQIIMLKYLSRTYPEKMAEAWFVGRYTRETHLGTIWTDVQENNKNREILLADMENQLRDTIIQAQARETLLADFERQLREAIEQGQAREVLLADFERQLRETIEKSLEREKSWVVLQEEMKNCNEQLQRELKRRFVLRLTNVTSRSK